MKKEKTIGWLLFAGAVGVLIPYTMLTSIFAYPDILRQDTGVVLTKFHEGGSALIWIWFSFAWIGIPLIPAYMLIGQQFENKHPLVRVATTIGVIGLVVQMVGLLRWTFVVPVLADTYVNAPDDATRAAAVIAFKTIHQFGGVILGEHIGQLFTIMWTVLLTISFMQLQLFPRWLHILGFVSAIIYLLAQSELFATVLTDFPVWGMAGFIGSSLWLVWLMFVGIGFIRSSTD